MEKEDITLRMFADVMGPTDAQKQQLFELQRNKMAADVAALPAGRASVFYGAQLAQDLGQAVGKGLGAARRGFLGVETMQEVEDRVSKEARAVGQPILREQGLEAYLNFLSDTYSKAGLTDKAEKAKLVADKITEQRDLVDSTIKKNLAAANKDKQASTLDQARQIVLQLAGKADLKQEEKQALDNAREVLKLSSPSQVINMTQESKFAGKRGELQASALDSAAQSAAGARTALTTLDDMLGLAKTDKLYTGALAMTALGAASFLTSLGLLSQENARTLANSEIYDKRAKDLVMQELGGKLGAQISNTDREFIEARIPQLKTSPTARVELINKLKEIQESKINLYRKMNKHANEFGNLNDFDFSQNYMPPNIISSQGDGTKENPIKLK